MESVPVMPDEKLYGELLNVNYFVCTLGQAATLNAKKPHSFKTANDFIDLQAQRCPTRPAVGFPTPPKDKDIDGEWDSVTYSKSSLYMQHRNEKLISLPSAFQDLQLLSISLGHRLLQYGKLSPPLQSNTTLALLCPSSVDFLFGWLALMRLGYSVLLIAYVEDS